MSETQFRSWRRIQDWVSLVAGGYLALSPLWVDVGTRGTWVMVITGGVVAIMAVVALAMPGAYIDEWMTAAVGAFAFASPWIFSFSSSTGAAWTSWVAGVVVALAAVTALPASRQVYREQHHLV
jgi:hypothetical protein